MDVALLINSYSIAERRSSVTVTSQIEIVTMDVLWYNLFCNN